MGLQARVVQSLQESLRRRQASGADFLKHVIEDKLDDWSVITNRPQVFLLGPENRSLYVRAFSLDTLERFDYYFGNLLVRYRDLFAGMDWLTYEEKQTDAKVVSMADRLQVIFSNSNCLREVDQICRRVLFACYENRKWRRRSWRRYWRRYVATDDILMIFFAVWCLNFDCQKKTVDFLLKKVGVLRSGTWLPPSVRKVSGLSGKSVRKLFPKSPFASDDPPKTNTSTQPKQGVA